jgi:hypothetical protein
VSLHDVPAYIERRISRSLDEWKKGLPPGQQNPAFARKAQETMDFYERELAHFRRRLEMHMRVANREPHSV